MNEMAQNGSPKPIFETDENRAYFLVRLPVHGKVAELERAAEELEGRVTEQVTDQVTEQVMRLLGALLAAELGTKALLRVLNLSHRPTFLQNYLQPALEQGLIEMTQPDSPRSPTQKYRLTTLGKQVLASTKGRT